MPATWSDRWRRDLSTRPMPRKNRQVLDQGRHRADLQADYLVAKLPGPGGQVCVFDLSLADPFADCTALYFADYGNSTATWSGWWWMRPRSG
jgi:hypothetical protein